MTPFGARVRELRAERGLTLKQMAADLDLSPAYLSALEHGRRGRPPWGLVQRVCAYFNIIWDDAEALAGLARRSHPRVVVDTAGLSPRATELANLLAERIADLPEVELENLLARLEKEP
jgi:transcriptional regulator with XRE-family HTH domain